MNVMDNKRNIWTSLQRIFWIGVSFLAIIIIIKCCAVTTKTDFSDTFGQVVHEMISDFGVSIYQGQSHYLSYMVESTVLPEIEDSNPIFKFMTSMFPIQQYTISEKMQMVMNGEEGEEDTDFMEVMKLMTNENFMSRNSGLGEDDSTTESAELFAEGELSYVEGNPRDSYYEEDSVEVNSTAVVNNAVLNRIQTLEKGRDYTYLIKNFYIVDNLTYTTNKEFNVDKMLNKDFSITIDSDKPQVLIYHTHATTEAFADSRKNKVEDTIVGIGTYLTEILEDDYGINVLHDTSTYDLMSDGSKDRSKAYDYSLKGVTKILEENPSIKVIIDLHRNSGDRVVTTIDGRDTAPIMLFNGMSRNANGDIAYLHNDNLANNLAFSLQVELQGMKEYPTLMKRIYLKNYRYNLHLLPRALLVELGSSNNTVEEARNAMIPFAKVLYQVLSGNTTK
ncbi:stage II sporulation protein P [Anaerosporobacter sp.]|uniref:stage II sporulation protein P n=1 Tax=Anaerosporobacter sp. TaxID=1872529 RepID=UPI00286EBD62|nr:stage II sporulation protein P [Anaerosporobacter sp.]